MDDPSDVFWGIFETGNSCINTYHIQMVIDYAKAYEELYLKEFLIKWSGLSKHNNSNKKSSLFSSQTLTDKTVLARDQRYQICKRFSFSKMDLFLMQLFLFIKQNLEN